MTNQKEMQPGIYFDLSNEDYHASTGISKSGLSLFAKCPEQYHWKYILGNKDEEKPQQFTVGSAFHTATLEPDKFDSEYVVGPDLNKNTKEWKAWAAANNDRQILGVKEYDTIMGMAEKVRKNPIAKNILSEGFAEASIYAIDEVTGELVKVRPDWINSDIIVDLKSTTDASAGKFFRDMFSYSYHVQAGMYPAVCNILKPGSIVNFIFIVVEKTPPYSVGIYRASYEDRMFGLDNFRRNLNRFADYKKRDYWPSYNLDLIVDTSLPAWAKKNEIYEDFNN